MWQHRGPLLISPVAPGANFNPRGELGPRGEICPLEGMFAPSFTTHYPLALSAEIKNWPQGDPDECVRKCSIFPNLEVGRASL
jgi:hypothetical protein